MRAVGEGDGVADGRAVHVDGVEVDLAREVADHPVLQGERALEVGLAREDHHAEPVVLTARHEVPDHLLGHGQPVLRLEVLGAHGLGHVHGDHDVHAQVLDAGVVDPLARPRQGDDKEEHGREAERRQEAVGAGADRAAHAHDPLGRDRDRGLAVVELPEQVPGERQRPRHQEQEEQRIFKLEV